MRPIEFRYFWQHDDTGNMVCRDLTLGDITCGTVDEITEELGHRFGPPVITGLQFTGLHDKNGVKIFEGDKVKFMLPCYDGYHKNNIVKYYEIIGKVIYKCDDLRAEFYIEKISSGHPDKSKDFYGYTGPEFSWSELEVIGKIFENEDLLK